MQKKLTITIDEKIYEGLHREIGQGNISQFIAKLVKPFVVKKDLDSAYKKMSEDKERNLEADEWVNNLTGDITDEPW